MRSVRKTMKSLSTSLTRKHINISNKHLAMISTFWAINERRLFFTTLFEIEMLKCVYFFLKTNDLTAIEAEVASQLSHLIM